MRSASLRTMHLRTLSVLEVVMSSSEFLLEFASRRGHHSVHPQSWRGNGRWPYESCRPLLDQMKQIEAQEATLLSVAHDRQAQVCHHSTSCGTTAATHYWFPHDESR